MIEAEKRSEELLTLRIRPRMAKTISEEQGRRKHHQQGWQIHLTEEEICRDCPKFRVIGPYFPQEGRYGDQERDCGRVAEGC